MKKLFFSVLVVAILSAGTAFAAGYSGTFTNRLESSTYTSSSISNYGRDINSFAYVDDAMGAYYQVKVVAKDNNGDWKDASTLYSNYHTQYINIPINYPYKGGPRDYQLYVYNIYPGSYTSAYGQFFTYN